MSANVSCRNIMKRHRILTVVVVLLLLPAVYVGLYYATVEKGFFVATSPGPLLSWWPEYCGSRSKVVQTIFSPAHTLDRILRPDHWWDYPSESSPANAEETFLIKKTERNNMEHDS